MKKKHYIIIGIGFALLAVVAALLLSYVSDNTDSRVVEDEIRGGTVMQVADGKEQYVNSKYHFSFIYPAGLSISTFIEGEGDVVLVQNQTTNESFQIYIASFDEPWPVTPERIKQDLPDMVIREPLYVALGGGAFDALIFKSEGEALGETREIWFIHDEHLYQVTTRSDLDALVGAIFETWQFQTT
jgi:hypothetical protein